jgi:hypothetical protein
MEGGSTLLADLPGGPPNNGGQDDKELLFNIINEVYEGDENGGGGGDISEDDFYSDDEEDNNNNNNKNEGRPLPPPPQYRQQQPQYQQPRHAPMRTQLQYPTQQQPLQQQQQQQQLLKPDCIAEFTGQIRDALIVTAIAYVSSTLLFQRAIENILPRLLQNVDGKVSQLSRAIIIGALFYAIKIYICPPDIVSTFVRACSSGNSRFSLFQ